MARERSRIIQAQARVKAMKNQREYWDPTYEKMKQYIAPYRGRFDGFNPNRGDREDDTLFDMTTVKASRTCASGLHSGVTNPARPWIKLQMEDTELSDFRTMRVWLDDVAKIILGIIRKSNFYAVAPSIYREFVDFGTACMFTERDFKTVVRCRGFSVGSYTLANGPDLKTNTMSYVSSMTALQIVGAFGYKNCPMQVKQAYDHDNYEQYFNAYNLIQPAKGKRRGINQMPVESLYWVDGASENDPNGGFLRDGGYDELPFMAPRWEIYNSDAYGKGSPGWVALGDSIMLQTQQEDRLETTDKVNNPPVGAPASMFTTGVSLLPAAVNWLPDGGRVEPIVSSSLDLNALRQDIQDTRMMINEAYYVDLFRMFAVMTDEQKTAREIAERSAEKLVMLGPMQQHLYGDFLDPFVTRVFDLAYRGGLLPPAPPEIQEEGAELKIEYVNVLSQAQQMAGITGIEQLTGYIGNVAQIMPDALDHFNVGKAVQEYADLLGTPSEVLRSEDEVAQIRRQRAEQEQQAQQVAMMQQAATSAKDLGQVNVGENNALEALLSGQVQ